MDSALPLLLFLAFLFGSMLLILVFGCRDLAARFDDDAGEVGEGPGPLPAGAATRPRFFGVAGAVAEPKSPRVAWAAPWASLEAHLRHEHTMASAFVAAPSLQMLSAGLGQQPPPYLHQFEQHIQDEYRRVTEMIHPYPVKSLYPHTGQRTFTPERRIREARHAAADRDRGAWHGRRGPGDLR